MNKISSNLYIRSLLVLIHAFSLTALEAAPAKSPDSASKGVSTECLACHDDESLTREVSGKTQSLQVKPDHMEGVHEKLSCTDCHAGMNGEAHEPDLPPAQCASCHGAQTEQYRLSIHGVNQGMGEKDAATCSSCHGSHGIRKVTDPTSPVYKFNLARTCSNCHANDGISQEHRLKHPDAAAHYMESIHGKALMERGLVVAPSCNDCHGIHDIRRSTHPESPINHANIARTCGKCHLGIEQIYEKSIHGKKLGEGDKRVAVCTDCHGVHEIENHAGVHFKAISDRTCGKCHEDRLEHYRDTYHGKALALGKPNVAANVAACYDCHGAHDVLPASDPDSHISKQNITETCQKCHTGANDSFAGYLPHANHFDRKNYPELYWVFIFMTTLLVGTFGVFGLHTGLWLVRSAYLYVSDSKKFRETKIDIQRDDEWFTRFTPFERFLHILVVTSFLLLVITGMPLKFYYTDWAKVMFSFMGGPDVARSLHHFGAVVTFLYFGLHLASLIAVFWKSRSKFTDPASGRWSVKRIWDAMFGPDSMVPGWQDVRDFIDHNRWFFGNGEKPQFDRWTYWEKFDYFAVFWGVFIIGFSGLVMWFPQFFTQFLPGWMINVALIIHSDEALLAAGFIFTFHFFNTHFRLEKFPMDTVIFTGRISKAEMVHERKRWYDRLIKEGRLDQHRSKDEWLRWKEISKPIGYLFFGTGVILLLLIIYAMLSRLLH